MKRPFGSDEAQGLRKMTLKLSSIALLHLFIACLWSEQRQVHGFVLSSIATKAPPTTVTVLEEPISSAPSDSKSKSVSKADENDVKIRIRSSRASDLAPVAEMLSTAVVAKSDEASPFTNWKTKMDQLWAKADIESLLRVRLEAIQEGRRSMARVMDIYNNKNHHPFDNGITAATATSKEQLQIMWTTSERLRKCIQRASHETGEDNVWRRHNFSTAPKHPSWLYHLQMSAQHVDSDKVVGFCEVAMLSNPMATAMSSSSSDNIIVDNAAIDDDDDEYDEGDDELCDMTSTMASYAPAITNLATAKEFRRRGIATRLLGRAERFVQKKWGFHRLGLYVEKENKAAMTLYESMGYKAVTTCDGGDHLGELWYMVRELDEPLTEDGKSDEDRSRRRRTLKTKVPVEAQ